MKPSQFPKEIQELILKRQVEQGHPADISVFDNCYYASKLGKGFDWSITLEGNDFWRSILRDNEFTEFYELYPQKEETLPEYYVIQQCDSPLWEKYIAWLNALYTTGWTGNIYAYYGYDGNEEHNGTTWEKDLKNFQNSPQEITLEYWDKCINSTTQTKQEMKVIISRELFDEGIKAMDSDQLTLFKTGVDGFTRETTQEFLIKFYGNVCSGWKTRMEKEFPFLVEKTLPTSFERINVNGYFLNANNFINTASSQELSDEINQNVWPTRELAEAAQILPALLQMRNIYNGDWVPKWGTSESNYCIVNISGKIEIHSYGENCRLFAFKTSELRNEFFKNFKKELEIAKPLI